MIYVDYDALLRTNTVSPLTEWEIAGTLSLLSRQGKTRASEALNGVGKAPAAVTAAQPDWLAG